MHQNIKIKSKDVFYQFCYVILKIGILVLIELTCFKLTLNVLNLCFSEPDFKDLQIGTIHFRILTLKYTKYQNTVEG